MALPGRRVGSTSRSASCWSCRAMTSTRPWLSRSPPWSASCASTSSSASTGSRSIIARLQLLLEVAVLVEHVGDAARHAGREVAARRAEHDDDAAGHVLAAVVAGAFDDRDGAGVAHGEALAGDAAEIALAGDGAVQHRVADDDALLRHDAGASGRAARSACRPRGPCRRSRWPRRRDRASRPCAAQAPKLWPAVPLKRQPDGVLGQAGVAVALGDLARQHGAGGAVAVGDGELVP